MDLRQALGETAAAGLASRFPEECLVTQPFLKESASILSESVESYHLLIHHFQEKGASIHVSSRPCQIIQTLADTWCFSRSSPRSESGEALAWQLQGQGCKDSSGWTWVTRPKGLVCFWSCAYPFLKSNLENSGHNQFI